IVDIPRPPARFARIVQNMTPVAGPAAGYKQRLTNLRATQARFEQHRAWAGNARFALLLTVPAFIIILAVFRSLSPAWLLLPAGGFVGLSAAFAGASRRLAAVRRATAYYDFGLARLEDRWTGRGVPGDEFLDSAHPCAADLDLFGRGSLFEL